MHENVRKIGLGIGYIDLRFHLVLVLNFGSESEKISFRAVGGKNLDYKNEGMEQKIGRNFFKKSGRKK